MGLCSTVCTQVKPEAALRFLFFEGAKKFPSLSPAHSNGGASELIPRREGK